LGNSLKRKSTHFVTQMPNTDTTPQTNTTTTLTINLGDSRDLERILAAHQADTTAAGQTLDNWLLGIILDWVVEVEKGEPQRSLGFGN
jgi:hypothetical protein